MFKFVVLFALVAVAAAKPGYLHGGLGYSAIAAPAVAYAAPVVHAAPAVAVTRTVVAAPIVRKTIVSAPIVSTYAAAPVVSTYAAAPIVKSYAAAPAYAYGAGHLGYSAW